MLCAVRLNKHVVRKPRKRLKGQLRRSELSVLRRLPNADRAVRGKRSGKLCFPRLLHHLILRRTHDPR